MGIDEQLTHEIVRRVLSVAKPDRIILFGSTPTRQMTPDSDIDLFARIHTASDKRSRRTGPGCGNEADPGFARPQYHATALCRVYLSPQLSSSTAHSNSKDH